MTYTVQSITDTIHATGTFTAQRVKLWAQTAAVEQQLDVDLFLRQIQLESSFEFDNVNRKSLCYGPAQLHPRFYPPEQFAHPEANVRKGAAIMRAYLDKYGTLPRALAAYNHGPANLDAILAEHPYDWQEHIPEETQAYLHIILGDDAKETTNMKLSWHFINRPQNIVDIANRNPPEYVKVLNPPPVNPFPASKVIGRVWIGGDQVEQDYINRYDAQGYLDHWQSARDVAPYVHAWELCNEPPVQTKDQRDRLNDFLCSCADRLPFHAVVGGNLSVGWPDKPQDILDLKDAIRFCDYWGVHEYGWLPEPAFYPYHLTRYRTHIIEPLRQLGIVPKLLIGECGMDGGVAGNPGKGWKGTVSKATYWAMLQRYAEQLALDPEVLAAFVFTSGPTPDWDSFDVDRDLSTWLSAAIGAQPSQTLEQAIVEEAQKHVIPWNPDAALARRFATEVLAPQSAEFTVHHGGKKYVCQVARPIGFNDIPLLGQGQRIAYCRDGDWGNVKVVEADND
jgi:hypothetical protein